MPETVEPKLSTMERSGTSTTLDQIIADIQHNWAWVIAPRADRELDDNRWDRALAAEFPEHAVWNIGDGFNYSKCYTYMFVVELGHVTYEDWFLQEDNIIENLGGQEHLLLLKLSVVAPYYLIRLLQRRLDNRGQIVETEMKVLTREQHTLVQRAASFAEHSGFVLLPRAFWNELVPGADLELAEPGTVTVYNCLFEDEHNLPASNAN